MQSRRRGSRLPLPTGVNTIVPQVLEYQTTPANAPIAAANPVMGAGAPQAELRGAGSPAGGARAGEAATEQLPPPPPRFNTPPGHYNNPVDNVFAAAHTLQQIPFDNSPAGIEARRAVDLLRTAVVQQNNNPRGSQAFNSEPQRSRTRSRHGEPPAARSIQNRLGPVNPQGQHQNQQVIQPPQPAVSAAQSIVNSSRARRAAAAAAPPAA